MEDELIIHNFTNHPPKDENIGKVLDAITNTYILMTSNLNTLVPDCREKSLMITNLEQASMWAKAAIARNQ